VIKKRIFTALSLIVGLPFLFVIIMSFNFCYVNDSSCRDSNDKPYLIKAKISSNSSERTVFTDIRPFVIFDTTGVIALVRDKKEDWPKSARPPSSSDTLTVSGEVFNDVALNQEIWIKYYVAEKRAEKAF
jgi:hypothetical protein